MQIREINRIFSDVRDLKESLKRESLKRESLETFKLKRIWSDCRIKKSECLDRFPTFLWQIAFVVLANFSFENFSNEKWRPVDCDNIGQPKNLHRPLYYKQAHRESISMSRWVQQTKRTDVLPLTTYQMEKFGNCSKTAASQSKANWHH